MFTKFGFACRTVTILLYLLIVYNIPGAPGKVNAILIFCLYNLFFVDCKTKFHPFFSEYGIYCF